MITILQLIQLEHSDIEGVIAPYTSNEVYTVRYHDSIDHTAIELHLVLLSTPQTRVYTHFDEGTLLQYNGLLKDGFSFGAYEDGALVGFIVAEAQHWNNSLWVREYHVAGGKRRQGIGRRLMETVEEKARAAGLRVIVCETQNTNAAAIKAYRAMGFRVEGIDISYYTNEDYPDREVAVFMKRRL